MYTAHTLLMVSTFNGATPMVQCHYCGISLGPWYDYSCISCGRDTCDKDIQWCPESDLEACEAIICFACVGTHLETHHPEASQRTPVE